MESQAFDRVHRIGQEKVRSVTLTGKVESAILTSESRWVVASAGGCRVRVVYVFSRDPVGADTRSNTRSNRLTIKDTGKLAAAVEKQRRSLTLTICHAVEQRILGLQEKKQSLADAATGEGNGQSKSLVREKRSDPRFADSNDRPNYRDGQAHGRRSGRPLWPQQAR